MTSHFPAFPHLYDPPADVVRLLRDVDPAADLLYMGWGKWYLVRYRPNRLHVLKAERALTSGARMLDEWRHNQTWRANPGAFRRLYGRYLFWTAVRLGARPVAEYDRLFIRESGFEAIVDDFRRMEWMYRHTSDADTIAMLNAEHEDGVTESRSALRDEYAATTMVDHLARNPHSVTSAAPPQQRSGFTKSQTSTTLRRVG